MKPMSKKGILIVVSGPSGGGKGTVVRRMREMLPEIGFSVSATTRPPRTGEVDGEDYYFITREKFTVMIGGGEMLEHTEYCGNFYGTPRAEVERVTDSGRDMILEIEVDGASQVKKKYPDAVTVMLIPPTIEELERRLRCRGSETEETIHSRLARALEEIRLAETYDYVVVNRCGDVDGCAERLCSIMAAEHSKSSRMTEDINNFKK